MDLNKLVDEIKAEDYSKPNIGIVSPEIRTINELVMQAVEFETEEEEVDNINI